MFLPPFDAMDFVLSPPSSRLHKADDNSFSYVTPPLDGSLAVADIYDFHYENNPNHPVFVYADGDDLSYVRFRELVPAAYNAARYIGKGIGIDIDAGERLRSTVAVLAASGMIPKS